MILVHTAVITVGNEIIGGKITNTNSTFIAKKLSEYGFSVNCLISVGDNPEAIKSAIDYAIKSNDLIVISGGLGATDDDITLVSVSEFANKKVVINDDLLCKIKQHFKTRDIKMPKNNIKQAMIIEDSLIFDNLEGMAPGSLVDLSSNKKLLLLPGVPREINCILGHSAAAYLERLADSLERKITFKVFKILGISESRINEILVDSQIAEAFANIEFGFYPRQEDIHLHVIGRGRNLNDCQEKYQALLVHIRNIFGNYIYAEDDQTIEYILSNIFKETGRTIYVAEGHTGGLICQRLIKIPGATSYFRGGRIIYHHDELMSPELEIDQWEKYGVISEYFVQHLSEKLRRLKSVDICLCSSGLAGPDITSNGQAPGSTFIALATKKQTYVNHFVFPGDREMIQFRASAMALHLTRMYLQNKIPQLYHQ